MKKILILFYSCLAFAFASMAMAYPPTPLYFGTSVGPLELDATNSPTDNYLPSYDLATQKFTWVAASGGGDLLADGTVPLTANWDVGAFQIRALTFYSDVATGTAPFTVASTTVVTNLNADTVDGESASAFQDASATLTSLAGLTETNGGIPYGTADNIYAWLAAGAEGTLLMGNGAGAPSWLGAGTATYWLVAAGAADPVWTDPATLTAGTATLATTVTLTDNENTNENNPIWFSAGAAGSGSVGAEADGDFYYNPSTGTLYVPIISVGPSTLPGGTANDSDAPGADKEVGKIYWNYIDGADGSENADAFLQAMQDGSEVTFMQFDESDDQVEFPKNTSLQANDIASSEIGTIVESTVWLAGGFVPDGTQCAAASDVQINSGPYQTTVICADNDASTLYGHVTMPDSWDAGNVTFELAYIQTAADTSALNGDVTIQCRGTGETVNNTWESEVAMDDAGVTGSNAVDHLTSGNVSGTCVAGDTLYWRWQMDATGTTTAVATLHFIAMKMEWTSNVGD